MNRQRMITTWCAVFIALMALASVSSARGKKEPPVLTAQGEKIAAEYSGMLEALKKEIGSLAPQVDENVKNGFTEQLAALRNVEPVTKVVMGKEVPVKFGPGNPAFVEKQIEVLATARALLKKVEAMPVDEAAYAKMARFALLSHAGPGYLAEFAQQGDEEKALIDDLLKDDKLVIQVMTLGGATGGHYGQAMRNYRAIQKATERSHKDFFQVWALASSLQYTKETYCYPDAPASESLVKFYLNYLKAYDDGILDPAFAELGGTGWNYRFVFPDGYSLEDVQWIRKVLRNYRPDHTRIDYRWRYVRIVRTDVPYTGGVARPVRPDLNLTRFQDYFLKGGICGPRAFVGQLSGYAFGIPSRRAPSPGHGAMAHWTPEGWTTVLGPHISFCTRVNGMPPMEFLLASQAQEDPEGFKQALMCDWVGSALDEAAPQDYGSDGGFWRLLGFYKRQAIVEDQQIEDVGATGEDLAESNETAEKEEVEQLEIPEEFRKITVAEDGTITIPVAACRNPENGEKIRFMESIDGGFQVHYSLGGNRPELLNYTIELPAAGTYEFTAHVCTVTVDRQFKLRINRRTFVDVDIPYTKADWMDTEPVELTLKEGRNSIQYTHVAPNKGVSIKYFTLKPVAERAASL